MMACLCWKALGNHDGFEGVPSLANLRELKEALAVVKSNYLHLLVDRYHLLTLGEIYFDSLRRKGDDVGKLGEELGIGLSSSYTAEF